MSLNDPLGDMLTRIRNACSRRKSTVRVPLSKLHVRVLEVLKSEGYIRDFSELKSDDSKPFVEVSLKYFNGSPVIRMVSRVSRGGRRIYVSVKNIPSVSNGLGVSILSTSKGVVADHAAREMHVGGEILCQVF